MTNPIFTTADILLPKSGDLTHWSVVACDQFTSQPEYWDTVEQDTRNCPSTYHITLPEVYLNQPDVEERIQKINETMAQYLAQDLFTTYANAMIYVERTLDDGSVRCGIVGAVDLEAYNFSVGSQSPVRATEQTVLSRIPPRVHIRQGACLELPHIMLLCNDTDGAIFTAARNAATKTVYDFPLMQNGGSICGKLISNEGADAVSAAIEALPGSIRIAVGDGNHSLASAKTIYENLKKEIGVAAAAAHPARYALAELVDVCDPALRFEPIHRTVFGVNPEKLLASISTQADTGYDLPYFCGEERGTVRISANGASLACGALQNALDAYVKENGGEIDYIHGQDTAEELARRPETVSFLLPVFDKPALFRVVEQDGVLPRKCFSMGHAQDKRYYLESRKITE